ncbi:MAG: hypothetical protein JRJ78_13925 [Deltaproteobacteria bacterium]|nr:hypothetical protein [Deltaproteobacteria bacterium]
MTVIRDDDAAAAGYYPYYLVTGDIDAATAEYAKDGGTVSAAWTVGEFIAGLVDEAALERLQQT